MTPVESYKRDLADKGFQYDPAQERVVHYAQALYASLLQRNEVPDFFWQRLWHKPKAIKGLYIWGGVGRGKTWIMDKLYQTLPMQKKCRVHFHQFIQNIHIQLRDLTHQANPLEQVAESIVGKAEVLFLDEFHVNDIADAMLCVGLFKALYARGITLITTSNIRINELYKEGLQRDQFIPVIQLLQKFTTEIELKAGDDFRFREAKKSKEMSDTDIRNLLEIYKIEEGDYYKMIQVNKRSVQTKAENDKIIWFDFIEICRSPRSTADYLKLAKKYRQVIVNDVPQFTENNDSEALRFIHLVDSLYDHRVQLKIKTDFEFGNLYHGRLFGFRFERTVSRLTEMHSAVYQNEAAARQSLESASNDSSLNSEGNNKKSIPVNPEY